jgi:hypothetical protein
LIFLNDYLLLGYLSKISFLLILFPIIIGILIAIIPSAELPFERARELAQSYHSTTEREPLKGKIAIVTGSTSGLGKAIASELYEVRKSYFCIQPFSLSLSISAWGYCDHCFQIVKKM